MHITLSTNFDDTLVKKLKNSSVVTLFGKLNSDVVGGGRPSYRIPEVTVEQLEDHIKLIHKCGMEFSYLLNSACLDNLECTKKKNGEIMALLDMIKQLNVDCVTVSIPYLIGLVRANLPHVKINISTFAGVSSIQKIRYYESLGVDSIALSECVNRDFDFLEKIQNKFSLDFHLMSNNSCLLACPFSHHHKIVVSHASQSDHVSEGFCIDYCRLNCTKEKLKHPERIIQSPWIRPEDLKIYEDIGIHTFKVADRSRSTKQLLNIVKSYQNRKLNGNLADIFNDDKSSLMPNFEYFNKPNFVDLHKIVEILPLAREVEVYIDNRKLDGFLDYFVNEKIDCSKTDCQECGYCASVAKKAITYNADEYKQLANNIELALKDLCSGDFFVEDDKHKVTWNEEGEKLLEKMVLKSPPRFKTFLSVSIRGKSEGNAIKRNSDQVNLQDILTASFSIIPKEYHKNLKRQLRVLGINVNEIIEQNYV